MMIQLIDLDVEYVGAATNRAIFDVRLSRSRREINKGLIFLSAHGAQIGAKRPFIFHSFRRYRNFDNETTRTICIPGRLDIVIS